MNKQKNNNAKSQTSERIGLLCMFLSALMFSISGLFIKGVPWSPFAINGGRNLIGCMITGLFLIIIRHKPKINPAVFIGAVAMASTSTLFVFANKLTSAANAIVLQFTSPVFIILLMWLIYREKPKKLDVCTCLLTFAGIVCFFVDSMTAGGMLGNVLALISGITYAGVFMMNTAKDSDPISSVFFGQLICAVIGSPFIAFEPVITSEYIVSIITLGILDIGLAYILFSIGIKRTPPVAAALVSGVEPIMSPIWVAIFRHEYISVLAIIGATIVLVSLIGYNVIQAIKPDYK